MHVYSAVGCAAVRVCVCVCVSHVFVDFPINPQFVGWNYSTSPTCRGMVGLMSQDYFSFRSLCECLIRRRWWADVYHAVFFVR